MKKSSASGKTNIRQSGNKIQMADEENMLIVNR